MTFRRPKALRQPRVGGEFRPQSITAGTWTALERHGRCEQEGPARTGLGVVLVRPRDKRLA